MTDAIAEHREELEELADTELPAADLAEALLDAAESEGWIDV